MTALDRNLGVQAVTGGWYGKWSGSPARLREQQRASLAHERVDGRAPPLPRLRCDAPLAGGHASPVRCWLHHFDIATLIELPRRTPMDSRTIGFGLSPGDEARPEPYFYVTPWPYPEDPVLPDLPPGAAWQREGWFGAVLTSSAIFDAPASDPAARERRVVSFLEAATRASAAMLGA